MAGFLDHLGQTIYDATYGKKETSFQEITLIKLWKTFLEFAEENRKVKKAFVKIERKGDHYEICMLAFNKDNQPIKVSGEYALGTIYKAYEIDEDIVELMDGNDSRFIEIETLKK